MTEEKKMKADEERARAMAEYHQQQAPPSHVASEPPRPASGRIPVKGQHIYGVKVVAVVPRLGALVDIPRPKKWREGLIRNVGDSVDVRVGDSVDVRVRDVRAAPERQAVLTLLETAVRQPE